MLLKLGRDVAPYKIYLIVHILMLLWQHARFQSLLFKIKNYHLRLLGAKDQIFCLVELQMVIFHFEEAGDWNRACFGSL